MDMHSGGNQKEKWSRIYIEAPKEEACVIFYNRFGHNPHRVTCTCCGEDYTVEEYDIIEEATSYDRLEDRWDFTTDYETAPRISVKEYAKNKDVLFIRKSQIKRKEREGSVPEQGYVWVG
jgi:hypothetical protein